MEILGIIFGVYILVFGGAKFFSDKERERVHNLPIEKFVRERDVCYKKALQLNQKDNDCDAIYYKNDNLYD